MSDLTDLVTVVVSASSVAGGGIIWLWAKVESRFKEIELKLQACEDRENEAHERRGKHLIVIEMLFLEVKRLTAGQPSAVLNRAKALLKELRDIDDDER